MRGSVRQYARPGREPRWRARYLHPDPPPGRPTAQIERTFRTRAEADRWLRAQLASLDTGRHVAPADQRRKFAELAEAWRHSWDGLEPRTREGYESVLGHHLLPTFGAMPLSKITVESVEAYLRGLLAGGPGQRPLTRKTVRNIHGALRAALNEGVRLGYMATNPAAGAKAARPARGTESRTHIIILSPENVAAVAEAMPTSSGRAAVLVAAYSGIRAGEQWGLNRADYDPLRGELHIVRAAKEYRGQLILGPTKTHESRKLTLPESVRAVLDGYLAEWAAGPDEPLFLAPEGGRIRHGLFRRRQYRPAVRASLPPELHGVRWHDLRHTHASMLISAGAPITAVSARLGHASTRMTLDVYGHMYPSEDAALAARLDGLASAAPTVLPLRSSNHPRP